MGNAGKITPDVRGDDDYFGRAVAISGNLAIVGAYGYNETDHDGDIASYAGAAYVFEVDVDTTGNGTPDQAWIQRYKILSNQKPNDGISGTASSENFGRGVAINGDWAMIGAHQAHAPDVEGASDEGAVYPIKIKSGYFILPTISEGTFTDIVYRD